MKNVRKYFLLICLFLVVMISLLIFFVFRYDKIHLLNRSRDLLSYLYTLDSGEYKIILTKRENILDKLENEVNKINYKELDSFKTNLLSYTSQIRDNISKYGDKIDTKNEYKYETLLISSIQMYYEFINEIKAA